MSFTVIIDTCGYPWQVTTGFARDLSPQIKF
jgi:hypothetical protein